MGTESAASAARAVMPTQRTANSPSPGAANEPPADARPLAPPYGAEPPDYRTWKHGYPPFSGRMFGSGN